MADRVPEQVAPDVVRGVRRTVLRPGQPSEASIYRGDTAPETVHFGVFADDRLAGVASLYREAPPGDDRADAWRLRGMATTEEARGTGLGGAVLEACIAHVAERGGGTLWCNARAVAVGFYLRYGLTVTGDEFEVADRGPHYRMLTAVAPSPEMRKAPTVMSERTLILVKPDGVARGLVGEVVGRIERKGLAITRLEMRTIARDVAERHYAEHVDKPFYADLVSFITSGPLVAMVVEGPDAVASMRNVMGATNPVEATPGSIRGEFATEIGENIVHGSDSPANGEREIKIFFPDA